MTKTDLLNVFLPVITDSSYPTGPAEGSKVVFVFSVANVLAPTHRTCVKTMTAFITCGFTAEIADLLIRVISGW